MRLAAVGSMVLVLGACGGAALSPPSPEVAPPVPRPEAPAASPAPGSPRSAPPPEVAQPLPPAVKPLSADEQAEADKKCRPIATAMADARKKGKSGPLEALEAALGKPPKMPPGDLERCTELMRRGIETYLQAAIEAEAQMMSKRLGVMAIAAYERETAGGHMLCPTTDPVPRDLGALRGGPFTGTEADWGSVGWTCLHFTLAGSSQRFQYQVKTDPGGRAFTVVARGYSRDGSRIVELTTTGKVLTDRVEVAPMARVERAP